MSNSNNRRAAAANRIRGPQSALTDFLASHNISALQISQEHARRVREAQEEQGADENAGEDKENESDSNGEDAAERKKRKRKEEMAIMKIKQSKEFKRRKFQKKKQDSDDGSDSDAIARSMLAKAQPIPGQLDNCEICEKRFTVTPYSKTGPDGGLLCTKCSKEMKDEQKKADALEKKKKQAPSRGRKRQTESDRLMGDVKPGAKSLVESCVRRVVDVVHDIDEFGDMPPNLLDRLSQILSRKRVLSSRTLELFLRADLEKISIYDCGKLGEEDFKKIFASMPRIKTVNLRFAGQMKNAALRYMIEKNKDIKDLQLGATNLISNEAWVELFHQQGPHLESLKLSQLNDSLNDEVIIELVSNCTNLRRLKLRQCSHITEASIESLSYLTTLEHLSLAVGQNASPETLVNLVASLGPNLRTLCLEGFTEADDTVLAAIHTYCQKLTKFRFTGNCICSDRAFADLFTNWSNPPIPFLDLSENRDIDNANPEGALEAPIGVTDAAFGALISHSGSLVERLDLHSCRHISNEALTKAFDGIKQYPFLRDIDFSFMSFVNDIVLYGVFKSCPALTKLAVFACFNARSTMIPTGIAVIGLPNAQDSIVVEGDATGMF